MNIWQKVERLEKCVKALELAVGNKTVGEYFTDVFHHHGCGKWVKFRGENIFDKVDGYTKIEREISGFNGGGSEIVWIPNEAIFYYQDGHDGERACIEKNFDMIMGKYLKR